MHPSSCTLLRSLSHSLTLSQVALLRVAAGGDGVKSSVVVEPLGAVRLIVDVVGDLLQVL